ncbi:MAG: lysylphosphatidylglycerol synthase transmembrane domain-containing protein [Myxococcales bacterium]
MTAVAVVGPACYAVLRFMRAVNLAVRVILSLGVSALFVWLSLRNADLRAVGRAIASASVPRMAAYAVLLVVIHLVRTVRWGILLEPLGHVGFKRLNSASAVGFMLLMLLPFRLGEFARPILIARPPQGTGVRLRRSGAMASIVVERLVDGIATGLLGVIALHALGTTASGEYAPAARKASLLVAAGFAVVCGLLLAALFLRERTLRAVDALLRFFSPRLASAAVSMLDAFISAVHIGSGFKAVLFFLLTALYWGLAGFGLWLLAPAFGFHITPLMAATILALQVVGVMIPAGPGMIGTLQLFTQIALSLFVADAFSRNSPVAARAAAYANTTWMLQFGVQVGLGITFMLLGHVALRGLFGRSDEPAADPEPTGAAP